MGRVLVAVAVVERWLLVEVRLYLSCLSIIMRLIESEVLVSEKVWSQMIEIMLCLVLQPVTTQLNQNLKLEEH